MNPETPNPSQQPPIDNQVPPSADQPPMPPKSGGNKMLIIVAVVIVALLIVGAGVFALMSGGSDDSSNESADNTDTTTSQTGDDSSTNDDSQSTDDGDVQSGEVEAKISGFAFLPDNITVKKGSTVTWTNEDSVQHNVVSDSDSSKSGLDGPLLAKGKSFSFTFDEVGEYKYHCQPHPNMTGTVTVVE